jgi:hypothetical protein
MIRRGSGETVRTLVRNAIRSKGIDKGLILKAFTW